MYIIIMLRITFIILMVTFSTVYLIQVLTILRTDCQTKSCNGVKTACIAIYIPALRQLLKSQGKTLPPNISSCLASLFKGAHKSSVLKLFLKPGSKLLYIKPGLEGRQSEENVYVRAALIHKSSLTTETTAILESGKN